MASVPDRTLSSPSSCRPASKISARSAFYPPALTPILAICARRSAHDLDSLAFSYLSICIYLFHTPLHSYPHPAPLQTLTLSRTIHAQWTRDPVAPHYNIDPACQSVPRHPTRSQARSQPVTHIPFQAPRGSGAGPGA